MPSVCIACVAAPCIRPAGAGNAARVGLEMVSKPIAGAAPSGVLRARVTSI
jgi:hypothetical protein